jgi:hypothetical protein
MAMVFHGPEDLAPEDWLKLIATQDDFVGKLTKENSNMGALLHGSRLERN